MDNIAQRLKTYIEAHPFDPGDSDCETVLDQLFQSITVPMSGRASTYCPPSMKALQSGRWKPKASAPTRGNSTDGSRQPIL